MSLREFILSLPNGSKMTGIVIPSGTRGIFAVFSFSVSEQKLRMVSW